MKHYTVSNLFPAILISLSFLHTSSNAKDYRLYTDCEEYYDSRGFYHNECEKNTLNEKKMVKSFNKLYDFMEPGDGPKPIGESNATGSNPLDAFLDTSKKKKKRSEDSLFEDDNEEEELTQPDSEIKQKSNNKALKERPRLEFGRE